MADLVAGGAAKLVVAGIQRGASLVIGKMWRIKQIDTALKQGMKSHSVKAALSDYEIVIGTLRGEFTSRVSLFHTALEKSGVLESLSEAALLGHAPDCLFTSYENLFQRFFPEDPGKARPAFDAIFTSFRVTFAELSKDKVLFETITAFHSRISERLTQIEKALVANAKIEADDCFEALSPTIQKIIKGAQSAFKYVRVETNKGAREVDITRIYIPPKLTFRESPFSDGAIAKAIKVLTSSNELAGGGHSASTSKARSLTEHHKANLSQQLKITSYGELKATFRRIVVLGDPGGGKSTLCQRLCYDMAKNAALAYNFGDEYSISPHEQKVPFRIILRLFEKARIADPQLDILSYLCRDLKAHVNADLSDINRALGYLLSTGRALIAFDGLDEILDTALRREYADLVVGFCNQFPLCPTLVTSRLVGYDYARLPDDFEELILLKFDESEVAEYTSKFMQVVGQRSKDEASQASRKFVDQTKNNAEDLRTNPLMLGLMCWLFLSRGDVPTNRPEIYRDCAILMFERWDPDRGIMAKIPSGFDRLQLFSELASQIYPDPELRAGVEAAWLEKALKVYFAEQFESLSRATEAAKSLVKFLTGRAWVMTDVGDGIFSFTHQTFLEYFFAKYLEDQHDKTSELLSAIKSRIVRREWDVVSHLCLQLKTYRNNRRQEEAIDILLGYLSAARSARDKAALGSFIAASLEYLTPNEPSIRRVVEALVREALTGVSKAGTVAFRDLSVAVGKAQARREFIEAQIARVLVTAFLAEGARGRSSVVSGLGGAPSPNFGSRDERRHLGGVRRKVLDALKPALTEGAKNSRDDAALAWSWYGLIDDRLVQKHGLAVYANPLSSEEVSHIDGITTVVLAASRAYADIFRSTGLKNEDAMHACRVLARSGLKLFDSWNPKTEFNSVVPGYAWVGILKEHIADPEMFLATILAFNYRADGSLGGKHRNSVSVEGLDRAPQLISQFSKRAQFGEVDPEVARRELVRAESAIQRYVSKGRVGP